MLKKPKQVLVFDEIDVGISGGLKLWDVSWRLSSHVKFYVLPTKHRLHNPINIYW
jgi:hypothetical protein